MISVKTPDDVRQLGTILTVFAHPDDESFACAGILAAAIAHGQRVVCMTATKGEVGLQDPDNWSLDGLDDVRAAELQEALSLIGCKDYRFMGYVDGACHQVDEAEAVAKVQQVIDEVMPQTILTFSPDGFTGHLDHQAVSSWVTKAAAQSDVAVYHTALTKGHYESHLCQIDKAINIFYALDEPHFTDEKDCAIALKLSDDLCATKCAALKAHRSQTGTLFDAFDHASIAEAFCTEYFTQA